MPPGYTAFFLWIASAILWWSGWRKETSEGIPDAAVAVFLAGWPFAAWIHWPVGDQVRVNGAFAWTALAMIALLWRMKEPGRWTSISAGLLIGSLGLGTVSNAWQAAGLPDWTSGGPAAAAAGAAACLLTGSAAEQIAAVTVAIMMPELLKAAVLTEAGRVTIGSASWMAGWWIAVVSARLLAAAVFFIRTCVMGDKRARNG